MSPGSCTESYPAFAHIGLRENPGKKPQPGRGGPIPWPPRSPDLNPLDFYLWDHLKSLVYSSPVPNLESLRNRIVACSEDIRNTPGVWDRVRRSMRHRCEVLRIKDCVKQPRTGRPKVPTEHDESVIIREIKKVAKINAVKVIADLERRRMKVSASTAMVIMVA
ncbi:hypothetical protein ANN_11090 [Periplaneta americana]|uniref:Uncharacterized protein n=1 Tax=Periplaneta americana TaxID=6978 RepID=A0ABQ8T422_PERAM|nr:hypothetical protein ANN_11090 [Periplaneta americana]